MLLGSSFPIFFDERAWEQGCSLQRWLDTYNRNQRIITLGISYSGTGIGGGSNFKGCGNVGATLRFNSFWRTPHACTLWDALLVTEYSDNYCIQHEKHLMCMINQFMCTPCLSSLYHHKCSFMEYKNYKIVYRRYASLYFIIAVDNTEVHH